MADPVIYSGAQLTISFARENSGRYPGAEFFESLDRTDKAKLMVLFKMLGDHGRIANPEKLDNLKNGLFEFKSHQIRMPFAYAATRRLVVITHGFTKKSPKASSEEITRAWRIFNEDQASAKLGLVRKQSE